MTVMRLGEEMRKRKKKKKKGYWWLRSEKPMIHVVLSSMYF